MIYVTQDFDFNQVSNVNLFFIIVLSSHDGRLTKVNVILSQDMALCLLKQDSYISVKPQPQANPLSPRMHWPHMSCFYLQITYTCGVITMSNPIITSQSHIRSKIMQMVAKHSHIMRYKSSHSRIKSNLRFKIMISLC